MATSWDSRPAAHCARQSPAGRKASTTLERPDRRLPGGAHLRRDRDRRAAPDRSPASARRGPRRRPRRFARHRSLRSKAASAGCRSVRRRLLSEKRKGGSKSATIAAALYPRVEACSSFPAPRRGSSNMVMSPAASAGQDNARWTLTCCAPSGFPRPYSRASTWCARAASAGVSDAGASAQFSPMTRQTGRGHQAIRRRWSPRRTITSPAIYARWQLHARAGRPNLRYAGGIPAGHEELVA